MKRIQSVTQALLLLTFAGQSLAFTLSQTPLFVTGNVAPNILLTLDDSGSMMRAYVPEQCAGMDCESLDHRRWRSSFGNPLYYNPAVTYQAPKNAAGVALATSFSAAWRNGFYTTGMSGGVNFATTINLSTSYKPTASLSMTDELEGWRCNAAGGNAGKSADDWTGLRECYTGDVLNTPLAGETTGATAKYQLTSYANADGSASGDDPKTNLAAVYVNGVLQTRAGDTNSSCGTRPGADNQFTSDVGGSTLTLCFRNNTTMQNKSIVVFYKASASAPAYYYIFNGSNSFCTGTDAVKLNLDACYTKVVVSSTSGVSGADERQNFANWYSFYRTRNLATISSAALAFTDLSSDARVAWQALNSCRDDSGTFPTTACTGWAGGTGVSNKIKNFDDSTHRANFFNWLFKLPAQGGTPLREAMNRAGLYLSDGAENGPYDNDFSASGSARHSCRRNFHILMTDGVWNGSGPSVGNFDNADKTLPDGTAYTTTASYAEIYKDGTSNTLADIAFKYWSTDLVPDLVGPPVVLGLSNNLTPLIVEQDGNGDGVKDSDDTIFWNAKNNPATWQHMVNFTVGLGLGNYLTGSGLSWNGNMYQGSYDTIRLGSQEWPAASADTNGVADLWHAAVNSRGRFYSADAPDDLVNAFQSIMAQVKAATPTAAALAANSTKAEVGTRVYQAKFDTTKWSGHLYAYDVNPADGTLSSALWDAATKVPVHGSRNIYSRNAGGGVDFTWSNLTTTQQTALNTLSGTADGQGSNRLAWIRGDTSKEQRYTSGIFRNRDVKPFEKASASDPDNWVLGDIISSDPEYVGSGTQGYDSLPASTPGQSTYASFVTYKNTRAPVVYVGANDGMLHAFDISTGVELFAVVPNAVFDNLPLLTAPTYNHRIYVDGSPSSGDAYLNNTLSHSSGWNTVVVSGLGGGGNSVFAVDATSSSSTAPSRFLWEFTDSDMGYTYSQPQIARLNDGSWAAVFGNGYKTSGGGSYLYVVNLATGALIRKIAAGSDTDNGLSTPMLVDTNNDKTMDAVYAGDLQGNMWKFDLSSSTATSWSVANAGSPLFTARDPSGNRQPITIQPTVTKDTSGAYWVLFGTGRYIATEDVGPTEMAKVQSFYGIADKGAAVPAYASRNDVLVQQTITATTTDFGESLRVTSDNAVDLSLSTVNGWYMDLTDAGERVVSEAVLVVDNVSSAKNRIVFVTAIPSTDPCNSGGDSWLMELLLNGRRPATSVFDLDGDGKFDGSKVVMVDGTKYTVSSDGTVTIGGVTYTVGADGTITIGGVIYYVYGSDMTYVGGIAYPVSGIKPGVGIIDTPTWLDKDAELAFKLIPGTSGSVATIKNKGKGAASTGTPVRVFWQQLM